MHVRTYSTNFAPPHFAAGGIPNKHPTQHNGKSHCLHLYFVSLPLPGGVLREARDVDAIIVTVFFLPGLESQRSLGTNFFIPKMCFVWHARSLQFLVVKQSHAFNMVWPLAAHR